MYFFYRVILAKMSSVWTLDNMTTILTMAGNDPFDPAPFSQTFARDFPQRKKLIRYLSLSISERQWTNIERFNFYIFQNSFHQYFQIFCCHIYLISLSSLKQKSLNQVLRSSNLKHFFYFKMQIRATKEHQEQEHAVFKTAARKIT